MNVCCVVAEYNPLHAGHAYQLDCAREKSNADCVIAAMSGSFVQRGEPAAYPKHMRAAWALRAGADLVIELPTAYSLQSAEGFCAGGVMTLAATGLMTHLSFGSECASADAILKAASVSETEAFSQSVKDALYAGNSFATALQTTYREFAPDVAELLERPNFLLGVNYVKALHKYAPATQVVPVERAGNAHDSADVTGRFSSASAFRKALLSGGEVEAKRALSALPDYVAKDVSSMSPASLDKLGQALLYALRTADEAYLSRVFGADEGLEHVLLRAGKEGLLTDVLSELKTKRYTLARLRRTLCAVLTGFTKELCAAANEKAHYIRVLGAKKESRTILGQLSVNASVPVLYKKADFDRLTGDAAMLFNLDVKASDVAALCFNERAGTDYTAGVLIR